MTTHLNLEEISVIYVNIKKITKWIYYPERIRRYFFGLFTEVQPEILKYNDSDFITSNDFSEYIIENNVVYRKPHLEIHMNSGSKHTIDFENESDLNEYIQVNHLLSSKFIKI